MNSRSRDVCLRKWPSAWHVLPLWVRGNLWLELVFPGSLGVDDGCTRLDDGSGAIWAREQSGATQNKNKIFAMAEGGLEEHTSKMMGAY